MMQLVFIIACVIFLLCMCFRWSAEGFWYSWVGICLFFLSVVGILLIVRELNLV